MEETEETNTRNRKCTAKTSFRQRNNTNTNKQPVHNHHHHHHLYHHNQILHHHRLLHHHHQSNRIHLGFFNQYQTYPPLLPLPSAIPLNFAANTTTNPPFTQNHINNNFRSKTHLQKPSRTSSNSQFQHISVAPPAAPKMMLQQQQFGLSSGKTEGGRRSIVVAKRPDSGGVEGPVISLLANHFHVQFDPLQKIFHYDVEITPNPSKEVARMIKQKLVKDNSEVLCGAFPVYDGRKNIYSPV